MTVFLQEIYQEESDSTFTHNGVEYYLNPILAKSRNILPKKVDISIFDWHKEYMDLDPARVTNADPTHPVLYVIDPKFGPTIIDGSHRLQKLFNSSTKKILAVQVPFKWLNSSIQVR